jgi:hypothetical protein
MLCNVGDPGGARTRDHMLKRHVLYQLSYRITVFAAGMEPFQVNIPAVIITRSTACASVAKLADAPALGAGLRKGMGVQVPPLAPSSSVYQPFTSFF